MIEICLTMKAKKILSFFPLLQGGFMVNAEVGCSIKTFLCTRLGVPPEYIDERIKTILLDGKAVDDVDSVSVKDGSILALSAAMPGLAGATLRRGGHLAALRSQITHGNEDKTQASGMGVVFVKLFNLIIKDLGEGLLKKGIIVRLSDIADLFRTRSGDLSEALATVRVDGREVDPTELFGKKRFDEQEGHRPALLRVDHEAF